MKKMSVFLLICMLCCCIKVTAALESRIGPSLIDEPEYESASALGEEIMRQAEALASANTALPDSVPFDRAVKVFQAEELSSGSDIEKAKESGVYLWKVPICSEGEFIYSVIRVEDGRAVSCSAASGSRDQMKQEEYFFDPAVVEGAIAESGLEASDPFVVTVPDAFVDIVCFTSGGKTFAVPFASRPDFWALDNAKVYPIDEVISALRDLQSGSPDGPSGGGSSGSAGFPLWAAVLIPAAALAAAAIVALLIRRSKARQ